MIMKRLLLICLVLCFWGEYGYAVEKQKDIEILYNRLLEEYLSDSVDVSQAERIWLLCKLMVAGKILI